MCSSIRNLGRLELRRELLFHVYQVRHLNYYDEIRCITTYLWSGNDNTQKWQTKSFQFINHRSRRCFCCEKRVRYLNSYLMKSSWFKLMFDLLQSDGSLFHLRNHWSLSCLHVNLSRSTGYFILPFISSWIEWLKAIEDLYVNLIMKLLREYQENLAQGKIMIDWLYWLNN